MTINIHKSNQRGSFKNDWLDTKYSFSFANYYNSKRNGFGDLKVLNDDIILAGRGFGAHPHNNMEIITLVLDGCLSHEDNMGNSGVVCKGDIQVMSAGKGIIHSEFNKSLKDSVKLFQIWIDTSKKGINPSYCQKKFDWDSNYPKILVSNDLKDGGLLINQNAKIIAGRLKSGEKYIHNLLDKRGLFVMNVDEKIDINGNFLEKRDSAEIVLERKIEISSKGESLILAIEVNI